MQSPDPRVVIDPQGARVEVEDVPGPALAISIRAGAVSMRAVITRKQSAFLFGVPHRDDIAAVAAAFGVDPALLTQCGRRSFAQAELADFGASVHD